MGQRHRGRRHHLLPRSRPGPSVGFRVPQYLVRYPMLFLSRTGRHRARLSADGGGPDREDAGRSRRARGRTAAEDDGRHGLTRHGRTFQRDVSCQCELRLPLKDGYMAFSKRCRTCASGPAIFRRILGERIRHALKAAVVAEPRAALEKAWNACAGRLGGRDPARTECDASQESRPRRTGGRPRCRVRSIPSRCFPHCRRQPVPRARSSEGVDAGSWRGPPAETAQALLDISEESKADRSAFRLRTFGGNPRVQEGFRDEILRRWGPKPPGSESPTARWSSCWPSA